MTERPLVSVIVPTKNSEETIERCLKSIRNQTYPNIEIIIVDNYSGDKTREISQKHDVGVYLKGPERASQVNFGVRKAKGKYIYRVDSDSVLERSVVEEAVNRCEEQRYHAVAVHNTSDPTISFWSKVRKFERDCYATDEFNIGARFLNREAFEAVGGFDETLIAAEDYDLHNRLLEKGFQVGRINSKEIHIGEPKTLREIVKKHYFYGKSIGNYIRKNPRRAKIQLNPIRLSYLSYKSQFLWDPALTCGFIIYQFVRYYAAALGFFAVKLKGKNIGEL